MNLKKRIEKLEAALASIRDRALEWPVGGDRPRLAELKRIAEEALEQEETDGNP